jgi:hypothetical protein
VALPSSIPAWYMTRTASACAAVIGAICTR